MTFAGLLYLGLFALAASSSRHSQLLPAHWGVAKQGDRLRMAAWLLVLASLIVALWSQHWGLRLITWIGLVPAGSGIVLFGLTYDVRWARIAALLAALLILAEPVLGG